MNKKKCPKCGEDNPPEAVMCWACYTPLSGEASPAAVNTPKKNLAAATAGDEDKKKIPPWQMAVVGVAVLGALFVGVRTMTPSGDEEEEEETSTTQTTPAPTGISSPPPPPVVPAAPAPPSAPVTPALAGAPAPAPQELPYKIVVPPNPRLAIATMAIIPTDGTATGVQAAALASYTRRQYKARTKKWNTLYIYVFSDQQSAQYFASYMKKKRGAALTNADYAYLSALWSSVLTRYAYTSSKGKRVERALYPSKNPNGWWLEKAT